MHPKMYEQIFPKSVTEDLVIQEASGDVLIYNVKTNRAHALNQTSALVWQMCDGTKSVDEISQSLGKETKSPANEDLVWLTLRQLQENNLIVDSEVIKAKFDGLSRREAIRRVGLASMIALPVISSVIAPTAAHAASGNCINPALGAPCNTNTQCQTRLGGDPTSICDMNCCVLAGPAIPGGSCIPGTPGCVPMCIIC